MSETTMVFADSTTDYNVNESPVLIAALAWVIAVGGVAVASIIVCGWRGSKSVVLDWMHGRATFNCR